MMNPFLVTVAAETASTDMSKVVTDGLTTVANQMTGVVSSVVPVALTIVGAVMVVKFGIKIFRSLTGR